MTTTTAALNEMHTFTVAEEILVHASLEDTFDSIITQLGRQNETPDGKPMPMMLETHPGGRWYRDLGGDNGHIWRIGAMMLGFSLVQIVFAASAVRLGAKVATGFGVTFDATSFTASPTSRRRRSVASVPRR